MKRILRVSLTLVLVILFVSQAVVVESSLAGLASAALADASSVIPPRTGSNLRELVEELINATPPENMTDTDGDGLPNLVEAVVGTDYNNTDSDFDKLNDYDEIMKYNTDPLDPDSNSDGLTDYYEVVNVSSLDIDGDGIENSWDFDNDDDGVNDESDLSPNSKSIVSSSFHFDINTSGNPTYITLQLKPKDAENLKLFYQLWDWPYDTEGSMKDLDYSKEDVKVIPQLNLTSNFLPDQNKVTDYGMLVTPSGMLVPLNPVWEYGDIVAFTAKIFCPASASFALSLDAELIWRVVGATDVKAVALNATTGKCVSVGKNGAMIAESSNITESAMFELIELGENETALKSLSGAYVSVFDNGTLSAGGVEVGDRESFLLSDAGGNKTALKAFNGKYVSVLADGSLVANSTAVTDFTEFGIVDLGFQPQWTVLVTYEEDSMLTGFSVEENYGCDLGLFCSSDINQTMAANLLMTYAFLRDSTTRLDDMPSVLTDHDLDKVPYLLGSFMHSDEALLAMSNEMLPNVLDSLPDDEVLPVIIASEDHLKSLELSEILSGSHVMGSSVSANLANQSLLTAKTMKTNMYNTTSNQVLTIEETMAEIGNLRLSENVSYNFMTMMIMWNTGEHFITKAGDSAAPTIPPENSVLNAISKISGGLFTGVELGERGILGVKAWRELNLLKLKGWNPTSIARYVKVKGTSNFRLWSGMCKKLSHVKAPITKGWFSSWKKLMKLGLEVLSAIIDVGLSILTGIFIAQSVGGRLGKEIGAQYGLFAALYAVISAVVLYAIAQIPYVGWLIALGIALADMFGGFGEKLIGWLVSLFYGDPKDLCTLESSIDVIGQPEITVYDKDNNGLDVGDRFEITARVKGTINHTGGRETYWPLLSWMRPYVSMNVPYGSFSTTGITGVPPSSSWNVTTGNYWKSEEYNSSAWIEPGIGMPNFPVSVQLNYIYRLWHIWEHFEFYIVYWEWCRHEDMEEGSGSSHFMTIYYDVLPGSINDFVRWRSITPLDSDGDGLRDNNETSSDPWKYDTDGDGLNDKFEVEAGFNARNFDTDNDGMIDRYELIYGTNATANDTDNDGLNDYLEEAGWVIPFNYTGDPTKPFTMHVRSDPRLSDTDGDEVSDYMEYWSDLNPRSKDTDGDGIEDVANPKFLSTALNFVDSWDIPLDIEHDVRGIAVDADGYVYVIKDPTYVSNIGYLNDTVSKFDSDGTLITTWIAGYEGYLNQIAVDNKNGYLYLSDSRGVHRYYFNGTHIASLASHSYPYEMSAMTVDTDGYIYVGGSYYYPATPPPYPRPEIAVAYVEKYDPNGTMISSWGGFGPDADQIICVDGLAVDADNGYIYISDSGDTYFERFRDDRVAKFDIAGNYRTSLSPVTNFSNPTGMAVDTEGYVYVADTGNDRIQKFNSDGVFIASWGSEGYENGNFSSPIGVAVGLDGYVYVLDKGGSMQENEMRSGRVQKFSQRAEEKPPFDDSLPDRDGDGLENTVETSGWNVTFTNATSSYVVHTTSDPLLNDTDSDMLTDYLEYTLGTNPRDPDTDDDGLPDYEEILGLSPQTNPKLFDTDLDELPDGAETSFGSDPTKSDTDDDGLGDLTEFIIGSNPADKDTDDDGLDDLTEVMFNSSLTNPDSDGDLMFDSFEMSEGTDPLNDDSDNDGLGDGSEALLGTDPRNGDTDGDSLNDGIEDLLWLNPLSNDTDGDGLSDSTEIEWGTSPWSRDTDKDGVPDGLDIDSNSTQVKHIVLAFDADNETSQFADDLGRYTNVTVVTVDQLLLNYKDAPYIVLVGRPDGNETVGKLIQSLLQDSGDVLTSMIESEGYRFAVRYGIWNETQTIVMLSHPDPGDDAKVLSILKSKIITVMADSVRIEYVRDLAVQYPSGGSLNHTSQSYNFFMINEVDTLKRTDAVIYASLKKSANPVVTMTRYNASTIPFPLTNATGLQLGDQAVCRYLNITVSQDAQNATADIIERCFVQIYYRESDLDRTDDGDADDAEDLNETKLTLYSFDSAIGNWTRLSKTADWVFELGVNTTDVDLYGEQYAGYVWAYLAHFSLFGLATSQNSPPDVSKAHPSIEILWSPNHKFVDVSIEGVTDPDGDEVTITIVSITSDEPTASIDGAGGSTHAPDAYGVRTGIASLRAERSGSGNGRVYAITFLASDGKGGEAIGTVRVYVPTNSKGNKDTCLDDGQNYDATGKG